MRRPFKLAAGALVAAVLGAGASSSAAEPLRTPQPDRLYLGRIAYEQWQPIILKTSPDGRRVKAAPGYFNFFNRCGATGGEWFDSTIFNNAWMPVRSNKTFAGTGRAWKWLDSDGTRRGHYAWTITGRFTSPRHATGRLTITGTWHGSGHVLRCPTRTVRWETRRTENPADSMRDF